MIIFFNEDARIVFDGLLSEYNNQDIWKQVTGQTNFHNPFEKAF